MESGKKDKSARSGFLLLLVEEKFFRERLDLLLFSNFEECLFPASGFTREKVIDQLWAGTVVEDGESELRNEEERDLHKVHVKISWDGEGWEEEEDG